MNHKHKIAKKLSDKMVIELDLKGIKGPTTNAIVKSISKAIAEVLIDEFDFAFKNKLKEVD